MDRDFKILNEEILSDKWGRLREITFDIKGRDGRFRNTNEEFYDIGNAVTVLLYNRDRQTVILNRQFRLPTVYNGNPTGMLTEVCAGKIEDLSPDDTAFKEVEEELGYKVKEAHCVMSLFMSPGSVTEMLHYYVAPYTPDMKVSKGGGLEEEGEEIEIHEVPYNKAMNMIRTGEIKDAKSVILLQYAGLHGLLQYTPA